jgi:DNA-binding transcriptional LysR family regulator
MSAKLELYRVFREVAASGSISAASKQLYISQSAVSQSIKQLEEQLGTRLFLRNSRGVELTADGALLYDYVKSALSLIDSGEQKMAHSRALLSGELVIGASDTITSCFLLPHLQLFHRKYPGIKIRILNGTGGEVVKFLRDGHADIAFTSSRPDNSTSLSVTPCFDSHMVFVAAPDYDCDFDRAYTMEEIAAFPIISLERKTSSRMFLENFFRSHGIELQPEIELDTATLQIELADIGLGITCVSKEFSKAALDSGTVRPMKTDFAIPPRTVCMCTLCDVSPTAAAEKFIEMVTGALEK